MLAWTDKIYFQLQIEMDSSKWKLELIIICNSMAGKVKQKQIKI